MAGERCIGESYFFSGIWRIGCRDSKANTKASAVFAVFYRLSGMEAQDQLMYLKLMSEVVSIGAGTIKDMRERPPPWKRRSSKCPSPA